MSKVNLTGLEIRTQYEAVNQPSKRHHQCYFRIVTGCGKRVGFPLWQCVICSKQQYGT